MARLLRPIAQALADLIWPPVCAGCGAQLPLPAAPGGRAFFCPRCWATIEFLPPAICPLCGRPFWEGPGHVCGDCLAAPPPYQGALAPVVYGGEAAHSLLKLKYHGDLNQVEPLAALAADRPAMAALAGFDAVIPMPLTAERRRQRGFNQAAELARAIYGRGSLEEKALRRVSDGHQHLASLGREERARAIRGCFEAAPGGALAGASLLLFDDILTTGATAGEAARALLAAGARRVAVRTIARAIPDSWR